MCLSTHKLSPAVFRDIAKALSHLDKIEQMELLKKEAYIVLETFAVILSDAQTRCYIHARIGSVGDISAAQS